MMRFLVFKRRFVVSLQAVSSRLHFHPTPIKAIGRLTLLISAM
jgi:hypothetical protein